MADLVGTTLGGYEIIEPLSQGGMADIYKAWQPSLKRHVALKVLASDLATDAEFVARFQQEAVAAANLNHTNIVTIYDVGSENDYHYIAMELVDGTSLQEHILNHGALDLEQVVGIITQVSAALDYAHDRGLIHRDIKPANVLIENRGRVVLTDFGIAEALSSSSLTATLSGDEVIFGTPHYMSPEQIKEESVDHRSDLYSLGIVCYEMLAGQVPFEGTTTHSIVYAQVHTPPPPLNEVAASEVPFPVEAVVDKMLAKRPEDRYASAGEFAAALSQATTGPSPSGGNGETALVDQEGRDTSQAAAAPEVRMVEGEGRHGIPWPMSRRALRPRGRWWLVLGVAAVIMALMVGTVFGAVSLLRTGETLEERLGDAQAAMGHERFEEALGTFQKVLEQDPDNVEALMGMAQAYEAQERWQQSTLWYERWTQVVPNDPQARLKLGWSYFHLEDYVQAIAQFKQVTERQPDWAEGWEGLGKALFLADQNAAAVQSLREWVSKTSDDVEAHTWLARAYLRQDDYERAIPEFQRVLALDDRSVVSYFGLGTAHARLGNHRDALAAYQRWAELEPEMPGPYNALGSTYLAMDDYEQAAENFQYAIQLDPAFAQAFWGLGRSYQQQGQLDDALEAYLEWARLEPENAETHRTVGWLYFQLEQYDQAIAAYTLALALEESPGAYFVLGQAYRQLGDCANAIPNYRTVLKLDPAHARAKEGLDACQ